MSTIIEPKATLCILCIKRKPLMKGMILVCRVSVIGGDLRQLTLSELMTKDGYDVKVIGFGENSISSKYRTAKDINEASKSEIIILPMPVTLDYKTINAPFENKPIYLEELAEVISKDSLDSTSFISSYTKGLPYISSYVFINSVVFLNLRNNGHS